MQNATSIRAEVFTPINVMSNGRPIVGKVVCEQVKGIKSLVVYS